MLILKSHKRNKKNNRCPIYNIVDILKILVKVQFFTMMLKILAILIKFLSNKVIRLLKIQFLNLLYMNIFMKKIVVRVYLVQIMKK